MYYFLTYGIEVYCSLEYNILYPCFLVIDVPEELVKSVSFVQTGSAVSGEGDNTLVTFTDRLLLLLQIKKNIYKFNSRLIYEITVNAAELYHCFADLKCEYVMK